MATHYSNPFRLYYVRLPGSRTPKRFTDRAKARAAAARVAKKYKVRISEVFSESATYFVYESTPGLPTRRVSTGERTQPAAKEWRYRRERESRGPVSRDHMPLEDATDEWIEQLEVLGRSEKTLYGYRGRARQWREHFGANTPLSAIGDRDILGYFRKRKAGPRTNNLDRTLFRAFFKWAIKRGYTEKNPAADLPRWEQPIRDPRVLSPEDVRDLLAACRKVYKVRTEGKRNTGGTEGGRVTEEKRIWEQTYLPPPGLYPAVVVALTTLLRLSNVLGLRWGHLDLKRDEVRIPPELVKTRAELVLPLAPTAKRALLMLPKGRSEDLVFGVGEIKKPFGSAVKRAGLKKVTFHVLRKTGATYLRERGVPMEVVLRLGGWSTRGSVLLQHYRAVSRKELCNAVALLDELVRDSATAMPSTGGSAVTSS